MDFWRIVGLIVVVFIAFKVAMIVLGLAIGIIKFAIMLAIIGGIIWLAVNLFSKKNSAY